MRITKNMVIQTASDIADKDGLNNLSLKIIAEKLAVRPPSLYNHIASLDDLLREVAHSGMKLMNEQMTQAAVGISGDRAVKSVCTAYFRFVIAHPGVYETIQWASWHGSEETRLIFADYTALLEKVIYSCQFKRIKVSIVSDLLMAMLHGFCTMQLQKALERPEETIHGLTEAIDTMLLGIRQKYD